MSAVHYMQLKRNPTPAVGKIDASWTEMAVCYNFLLYQGRVENLAFIHLDVARLDYIAVKRMQSVMTSMVCLYSTTG